MFAQVELLERMSIRSKTSSFKEIRGLFLEGESHLAMAFID